MMHVVAIHSLNEDKDKLAPALAAVLKVTNYEALMRLRAPGNGPFIVAVFAERERAAQLAGRLQEGGFSASFLTDEEIESEGRARIVKRFSLGDRELGIGTEKGENLSVPFQEIDLILRGIGIARSTTTETVKGRSLSLGRAVLSGGLMMTKKTKDVREITTEEREGFFNIYAGDGSTFIFRENALAYDSLGPALRPSRAANFTFLIAELRRLCPAAKYDERLLNRAGQVALLGPLLRAEDHLATATALLSKVLRKKGFGLSGAI